MWVLVFFLTRGVDDVAFFDDHARPRSSGRVHRDTGDCMVRPSESDQRAEERKRSPSERDPSLPDYLPREGPP